MTHVWIVEYTYKGKSPEAYGYYVTRDSAIDRVQREVTKFEESDLFYVLKDSPTEYEMNKGQTYISARMILVLD